MSQLKRAGRWESKRNAIPDGFFLRTPTPPDTFTAYDGTAVQVRGSAELTPGAELLSNVAAMLKELCLQVGYILDTLEAEGVADNNTLVIFTSDNGGAFGLPHLRDGMPDGHFSSSYDEDSNGVLQPLRGGKFDMYESGHRVPFIAKWGDGTPLGSITGDTNRDGVVDIVDSNNVRNNFVLTGRFVKRKVIYRLPLNNVRNHFGATAVPEPTGGVLAVFAMVTATLSRGSRRLTAS